MPEIAYLVRGFFTVRSSPLRVPLAGALTLRPDLGSGRFTGNLTLTPSTVNRAVSCRTAGQATVPLRSAPGFRLDQRRGEAARPETDDQGTDEPDPAPHAYPAGAADRHP